MTREEIEAFVTETVTKYVMNPGVMSSTIIVEIVDKWEADVETNRDEAFTNGQQNVYESQS